MKVEVSEDKKTIKVISDYGDGSREIKMPTDMVCMTVSRWLLDYVSNALLDLGHPKVKVRGKEEANLKETLLETAEGVLRVRDLLRDFTSPPSPSTMNALGAPSDTECLKAVNTYILEQSLLKQ